MSTLEIAQKFVSLVKEHKDEEALKTLFAADAVSLEPAELPGLPRELHGIPAIHGKGVGWREHHEVHSVEVEGPYPHGDRFAVHFRYDITRKAVGQRIQMSEIAVYTVRGDKIVREEFFFPT